MRRLRGAHPNTITSVMILLVTVASSAILFPYKQAAYAHTFTGDESASFMSVIKIVQAESNLISKNLPSNLTLSQDHAKAVVGVINGNHTFGVLTDEVSENNKRVAGDVIHAANALQSAVKSGATQADLKPKIDNLNATLQEAVAVRLPKDAAGNSTINGLATKNLVNETLRQYSYAFGITKGGNNSGTAKASDPDSTSSIVNMSAYQSAQALASQAQKMLSPAKSVIPTNATFTTKAAIAKLATDLSQLKNTIDSKDPYNKVSGLVQKTIYPDLDTAFRLK